MRSARKGLIALLAIGVLAVILVHTFANASEGVPGETILQELSRKANNSEPTFNQSVIIEEASAHSQPEHVSTVNTHKTLFEGLGVKLQLPEHFQTIVVDNMPAFSGKAPNGFYIRIEHEDFQMVREIPANVDDLKTHLNTMDCSPIEKGLQAAGQSASQARTITNKVKQQLLTLSSETLFVKSIKAGSNALTNERAPEKAVETGLLLLARDESLPYGESLRGFARRFSIGKEKIYVLNRGGDPVEGPIYFAIVSFGVDGRSLWVGDFTCRHPGRLPDYGLSLLHDMLMGEKDTRNPETRTPRDP